MPNPVGDDKAGEYIKLFNDQPQRINLSDWSVKDASGKTFRLSGFLDAGQELVLPYSQTKIALNNNGEQVLLYDNSGNLVDELNYSGQAKEGQIITRRQEQVISASGDVIANSNLFIPDSSISKVIFLDVLIAVILAGLGLYIILQLERKLEIKLF